MGRIKMLFSFFIFVILLQNSFAQWSDGADVLPDLWGLGYKIDAIDEGNVMIAVNSSNLDNNLFITNDAGISWTEFGMFDSRLENITDISMVNSLAVWVAVSDGMILNTIDGGTNWTTQYHETSKTTFMNYIEMFDSNNGIAMGDAINSDLPAVFLKTEDGGSTWISVNDSAFGYVSGDTWRRLDFVNPMIGYFAPSGVDVNGGIFKTTDGGARWNKTEYSSNTVHVLKFYDEYIGLAYNISDNISYIYRTTDGGKTWETFNIEASGWGNDIEFLPNNPAEVWFTDYYGVFFSSDTGRTWESQSIIDDDVQGRDIVFVNDSCGWILSDNKKLFSTNNNGGIPTSVSETIPNKFELYQNYPNPFNPSTTIGYSIAQRGFVELNVYDILGQKVVTLVNMEQLKGSYKIDFNASNLTSGVYFYRLQSNDFTETKKLILLR